MAKIVDLLLEWDGLQSFNAVEYTSLDRSVLVLRCRLGEKSRQL